MPQLDQILWDHEETMGRMFRGVLRGWFDLPLMFKGTIVISIPLICILFSAAAIYIFQAQRNQLTEWIVRAFQSGTRIGAVANMLVDAENGARGYLLTHDDAFLETVRKADRDLPQRVQKLREWMQGSESQLKRVERIDELSRQRMAALHSSLTGQDPRALAAQLETGRTLWAALDQQFNEMRAEESRLWTARIAAETSVRKRLTAGIYGTAILSLLAGILAMALFVTGVVQRAQLLRANAHRLAHGQELTPLGPGADEIGQLGEALSMASRLLSARETELRQLNQELDQRVKERTAQLERETVERLRSEEQLRQSQKMEAIGRLAGGVAHDFNNVLTVLFGFSESLREKLPADAAAHGDLDEIMRASEHAASLTRQLLAFSRRQIVVPVVLDVNAVVARTSGLLRRLIGEDVELQLLTAQHLHGVRADEGQIEQLIMNLAVNARDAMPLGGKLTLRTEMVDLDEGYCHGHIETVPGRYVMLSVTDTGQGMTAEVQSHLFEPFYTTKERGKGTGLGLSTVYGIVKQNNGNIWVYSEPGMGTTIKIYLPALGMVEERAPEAASQTPSAIPAGAVLLVEDEPSVRRMTERILVRGGYVVVEADGAEMAHRVCREHTGPIELLLTDVIMPKTNGRQLAQELQASMPNLKVLYMSGYTDDIITQHGVLDAGAAFIEKPFTPRDLLAKVREVVTNGSSASSPEPSA